MDHFSSVLQSVTTDGNFPSVVTNWITDGKVSELKKKAGRWSGGFGGVTFPDGFKTTARTVTWPVHHLKCRQNHRGIQNARSIRWHVDFSVRITNGITDGKAVGETVGKKLIYVLSADHLLPYFSFFFLIPTLPICKQPAPLPPKQKSPSSQHNKLYFLKFCGHSIRVLIYRWILSIFVSNSIFLNSNI